jgi:N-acetylglucosaminyldiphosphoundecaprenol N-acetyl-beta-D-mannosaminyltransferase
MAAHVGRLTAPVLLGVGAAYDIHLAREPRRLWRRCLHNNANFLLANIRHRPSMMVADW